MGLRGAVAATPVALAGDALWFGLFLCVFADEPFTLGAEGVRWPERNPPRCLDD